MSSSRSSVLRIDARTASLRLTNLPLFVEVVEELLGDLHAYLGHIMVFAREYIEVRSRRGHGR